VAFAVVIARIHLDAGARVGGAGAAIMAVRSFFLLSGFYMAMILSGKYAGNISGFYRARALRLLPLYWIVVVLTLCLYWTLTTEAGSGFMLNVRAARPTELVVAAFSNMSFIGLDVGRVLCQLELPGCRALAGLTVVAQAWTLGLEVVFYLIAPALIVLRFRALAGLAALSVAIEAVFVWQGVKPFSALGRQCFPRELVYFILGVGAFHMYKRIRFQTLWARYCVVSLLVVIAMVIGYEHLFIANYRDNQAVMNFAIDLAFYLSLTLLVPFLFHATRDSEIDRFLGELSYPIYITRVLALTLSMPLADALAVSGP
jgi:peptidoglycan/LPS O-acetylase OafA/YrhL